MKQAKNKNHYWNKSYDYKEEDDLEEIRFFLI